MLRFVAFMVGAGLGIALSALMGCSTGKIPPGPPPTHHIVHFWYGTDIGTAPLAGLHAIGVQAAYIDLSKNPTPDVFHAAGVLKIAGMSGDAPETPAAVALYNRYATNLGTQGVDYLYINEPGGSPAYLANLYNGLFGLYKQAYRLAGHTGTPMAGIIQDKGSFHVSVLQAGLHADFAGLETYSGDTASDVATIKAAFPAVKIMMLAYGRSQMCDPTIWQNNQIDYFGFWNVDNSGNLGASGDSAWPADAIAIARIGC